MWDASGCHLSLWPVGSKSDSHNPLLKSSEFARAAWGLRETLYLPILVYPKGYYAGDRWTASREMPRPRCAKGQSLHVFCRSTTLGHLHTKCVASWRLSEPVAFTLFSFVCACAVLRFELRAYTLSHSTSTFLWFFFFQDGDLLFLVERGSWTGLELKILLPQPPKCWDYMNVPPWPAPFVYFFFFGSTGVWLRASCLLGRHSTTWVTAPALFCVVYFWDRVSNYLPGLALNH
jgi:hypothetical protein